MKERFPSLIAIPDQAKKIIVSVCVFSAILLENWISDGVEGNTLFSRWHPVQMGQEGFSLVMIGMLIAVAVLSWFAYYLGSEFLSVGFRNVSERGEVEPKAHLIFALSDVKGRLEVEHPSGLKTLRMNNGNTLTLDGSARSFDEKMAQLTPLACPVEQFIRGVKPHIEFLKKITFLGSDSSLLHSELFAEMMLWFFPELRHKKIDVKTVQADFTDLIKLSHQFQRIIEKVRSKNQLSIDITGGTKLVSAAGAMATLNHPEIDLQYVETKQGLDDDKKVISFNVVSYK
jgi:hypothetical protein